jgi:hydrogenase expression/formation protein HypE
LTHYVANEGCFVIFVPAAQEREALDILSAIPVSPGAVLTGSVVDSSKAGPVVLKTKIGCTQVLDLLSGEQLPQIC